MAGWVGPLTALVDVEEPVDNVLGGGQRVWGKVGTGTHIVVPIEEDKERAGRGGEEAQVLLGEHVRVEEATTVGTVMDFVLHVCRRSASAGGRRAGGTHWVRRAG
jgi:hypothetical protein